jgi:hypothetical protein
VLERRGLGDGRGYQLVRSRADFAFDRAALFSRQQQPLPVR